MTTTTLKQVLPFAVSLALLAGIVIGAYWFKDNIAHGSVEAAHEYMATTTASNNNTYGNTISDDKIIATSSLTLGSVVITGANTAVWNIYDATTTDINKRTDNKATSSILVASFPASLAAGTYVFDVRLTTGLIVDVASGIMPTTTITWRR